LRRKFPDLGAANFQERSVETADPFGFARDDKKERIVAKRRPLPRDKTVMGRADL
jgi:hypothetical protein